MFQRGRGKTGVIGSVGEVSEQLSVGAMGKLLGAGGILRHPTNSAPSSPARPSQNACSTLSTQVLNCACEKKSRMVCSCMVPRSLHRVHPAPTMYVSRGN